MSNPKQPEQQEEFKVPPGGSLGLLALGAVGIRAWRKAREEYDALQSSQAKSENDD